MTFGSYSIKGNIIFLVRGDAGADAGADAIEDQKAIAQAYAFLKCPENIPPDKAPKDICLYCKEGEWPRPQRVGKKCLINIELILCCIVVLGIIIVLRMLLPEDVMSQALIIISVGQFIGLFVTHYGVLSVYLIYTFMGYVISLLCGQIDTSPTSVNYFILALVCPVVYRGISALIARAGCPELQGSYMYNIVGASVMCMYGYVYSSEPQSGHFVYTICSVGMVMVSYMACQSMVALVSNKIKQL